MNPPALQPGKPRHEQISDWLSAEIEQGRLGVDERLPSESEIGAMFGVSRITVRRALQTLEHERLIYRRQGLGSFVRGRTVRQGLVRLTDFVEDMAQAGLEASSEVRHHGSERASAKIADALGLEAGTPVLRLDRLRLANEHPVAFDRTWLPPLYGGLLEGHDLSQETIYHVLERDFDIPVLKGRFRISASAASKDVAEALKVPRRSPLLLIERVSFTAGEQRVYFQRRYYRSDRVAYEVELQRPHGQDATEMPLHEFEPVFNVDRE